MADGAGAGAILIGWMITDAGMLMLTFVYQTLSARKPNLDNGVYAYVRASYGKFVGLNSAWCYWVGAWVGNVGDLVSFLAYPNLDLILLCDLVGARDAAAARPRGGHCTGSRRLIRQLKRPLNSACVSGGLSSDIR